MAICRVEADGGVGAGPWLIALSDLVTFDQPRAESPPESVALLKQYYGLQGQLDQHVAELKQQAVDANPFAPAYRDAAQRYNAFGDREKRLTVQRDQARGADRMRISDELRAMIPEGARLQRDLDASKAKYQNWKSTHAAIANVDPASDPQVKELKQRLAALDPRIKEIVKQ